MALETSTKIKLNKASTTLRILTVLDKDYTIADEGLHIKIDGSVAFTGDQSLGSFKLTSVGIPTTTTDATNKTYVDSLVTTNLADYTKKDGSVAFTGDQSMGSNKITNLAALISTTDASNKGYIDNLIEGLKWKQSVLISSSGSNLILSGEQTIDDILTSSSRILVKDQADANENGIYITNTSAWTRSDDAYTGIELIACAVNVEQGTVNKDVMFVCTNDTITLGVTEIVFVNLGSTISHNNTTNLQGGSADEYNHLTNAEKTLITTNQTDIGIKVSKVTSIDNAIVRFDGTSGEVQDSLVTIDDNGITIFESNNSDAFEIYNNTSGFSGIVFSQKNDTTNKIVTSAIYGNISSDVTGAESGEFLFYTKNAGIWSNKMKISSNGVVVMPNVYSITTAGSANVNIDSSGTLRRSTSSLKYKDNINYDGIDSSKVYGLKPVSYQDKNTHIEYLGFIVEDVHEVEPRLVEYNDKKEPDALHYPHFTALNTKAIQDLKAIIDKQQLIIEQMQIRLDALEA